MRAGFYVSVQVQPLLDSLLSAAQTHTLVSPLLIQNTVISRKHTRLSHIFSSWWDFIVYLFVSLFKELLLCLCTMYALSALSFSTLLCECKVISLDAKWTLIFTHKLKTLVTFELSCIRNSSPFSIMCIIVVYLCIPLYYCAFWQSILRSTK